MGLIFNGNGDVIKAVDGSLTVEGIDLGGSTNINAGIATFSGNVNVGGVLTYEDVKNVDSVGIVTAREGIFLPDTKELKLGNSAASPDLKLYSTGTNGWVFTPQSGADLYMGTNAGEVYIQTGSSGNDTAIKVNSGGSVELNHNNVKKFATNSDGVDFGDNVKLRIGDAPDYKIYHNGSSTYHENYTGDLIIKSDQMYLASWTSGEHYLHAVKDGRVALYYDNVAKLETTNTGATVTSDLILNHASGDKALRWATGGTNKWSIYHNNGAGALVAFDNANNAERLRIDSGGRLLIGQTVGYDLYANGLLQVSATSGTAAISVTRWSNNGSSPYINLGKSRGAIGSYTVVQDGDRLGQINFTGADGTDLASHAASIAAYVDGTPGSNDMPGRIVFATASDGGAAETERLRINSAGDLKLNQTQSKINLNTSDGSDNKYLSINGGGDASQSRGAGITLYGNEVSSQEGRLQILAGNSGNANGVIQMHTGGAERLRITPAGNMGLGNDGSFPIYTGTNDRNFILGTGSEDAAIQLHSGTTKFGGLYFGDATSGSDRYMGYVEYKHDDNYLRFATSSTERLRIHSSGQVQFKNGTFSNNVDCIMANGGIMEIGAQSTLKFRTATNMVMQINSSGQMCLGSSGNSLNGGLLAMGTGHGSNIPSGAHLKLGPSANTITFLDTNSNGSDTGNIQFWNTVYNNCSAKISMYHPAGNLGGIDLHTHNGSSLNRIMRLNSDKSIRIGDSTHSNGASRLSVVHEDGGNGHNDCCVYIETNANDWCIKTYYNSAGTHYHAVFMEQGAQRGSIYGSDNSNVNFNQGSDYRWKENIVEMTGTEGIDICKKLKPSKYNWIGNRISTGQINTVDGFIAHEVAEAGVLGAVSGEKDAVNEDGSIKGQELDYGQMTPVLAAAIKGLIAKVETLETEVAALKSA